MNKKINIAVFISGQGTNLQALIDSQGKILLHGQIALVLSSNEAAYGLERAKNNGIATLCLNEKKVGGDVFYSILERKLRSSNIGLIILAGYLPLLSADFTKRWNKKIINIHPSLLPKYGGKGFYGLNVHRAVLENRDEYTGATIHYVNEELDGGEIIVQQKIKVTSQSAEQLQNEVLRHVEWKLLPNTVERLCRDLLAEDRRQIKVAILGSGGREHSLVRKISKSPLVKHIVCIPGNDGIIEAENVNISLDDSEKIILYLTENDVDLCIVGPEKPLSEGIADKLCKVGIACFGPSKAAARIESSKVYAKALMQKYSIPTADFSVLDDYRTAKQYVRECVYPIVIKADGLCGGKGVFICDSTDEADYALDLLMRDKMFFKSGSRVIIEEKLCGTEISVMALTDGKDFVLLPSAKDYKRAYDEDEGPNTGGMGAIAPHPIWSEELERKCIEDILKPTLSALTQEGIKYIGCLYLGLMLTNDGLKVLEYNCRFGDPEAEVVLPLIENDILPILFGVANGDMKNVSLKTSDGYCCAVVLAANGYPKSPEVNLPIANIIQNQVICSGVKLENCGFVTNSGRVVCAIGSGETKERAIQESYNRIDSILYRDLFFRRDIGS